MTEQFLKLADEAEVLEGEPFSIATLVAANMEMADAIRKLSAMLELSLYYVEGDSAYEGLVEKLKAIAEGK